MRAAISSATTTPSPRSRPHTFTFSPTWRSESWTRFSPRQTFLIWLASTLLPATTSWVPAIRSIVPEKNVSAVGVQVGVVVIWADPPETRTSIEVTWPSTRPVTCTWALTPGPSMRRVTLPAGTPDRAKRPSSSTSPVSDVPVTLTVQPLPPARAWTGALEDELPRPAPRIAPWSTAAPLAPAASSGPVTAEDPPQPAATRAAARPTNDRTTDSL